MISRLPISNTEIAEVRMKILGDVQPYLALGQELLKHGHRVRIATQGTFRQFIAGAKLEIFDIGGDPQELMSYLVRSAFVLFTFFRG